MAQSAPSDDTGRPGTGSGTWGFLPVLLLGLVVLLLELVSPGNSPAQWVGLALTAYGVVGFFRSTGAARRPPDLDD